MPPEKGMNEDKKARLAAIRAANEAKKAAEGGVEESAATVTPITVAPAAEPTTTVAVTTAAAPAKAGATMSEDKKAKLEAIRAANAAKKGEVVVAAAPVAAPAPVQPTTTAKDAPAAPTVAAAPARSGTRVPNVQQGQRVIEDDRIPARVYAIRAGAGALFGLIICLGLASETHQYLLAAIWGVLLGAALGLLVLSWPPVKTTGE